MMEQHEIMRERGWERVAPVVPAAVPARRRERRDRASCSTCAATTWRPSRPARRARTRVMEAAELIRRGDADVVLAGGGEACIHPLIIAGFTTMKGLGSPRAGRGPGDRVAAVRRHARRLRLLGGRDRPRDRVGRARRAPRRPHPRRGRRAAATRTTPTTRSRRGPTRWASSTMMRVALEKAGIDPVRDRLHQPARHLHARRATRPRRRRSRRSSATTPTACASRRRSRPRATSSAARARSRSRSARSRCATRSCPPTLNYRDPDPECDLDYVPEGARKVDLEYALSNSMGLGGHNGCVILRRHHG